MASPLRVRSPRKVAVGAATFLVVLAGAGHGLDRGWSSLLQWYTIVGLLLTGLVAFGACYVVLRNSTASAPDEPSA